MRPGRPDDLSAVVGLLEEEIRARRREVGPSEAWLRRMLGGFDWATHSRMADSSGGRLQGAVLLTRRDSPLGTVARVEFAVSDDAPLGLPKELVGWGLGLSKAAGAAVAQAWIPRGRGHVLDGLGLALARPWWRMDRSLTSALPDPAPVPGYRIRVGSSVARGVWADVHNRSFADHWRFSPPTEDELMMGRPPELALLAEADDGLPAAITLSQVQSYATDERPQPVGIVGSVGTIPGHRRKGLAGWLLAESLARLRRAGARHASLYVDAWNSTRAADLYRKLGFDLAFETEVWEATFP